MQDTPQNRYRKKNLWTLSTTFNRATEPDLIERVKQQDNKQGYIKALIRADMAKEEKLDKVLIRANNYKELLSAATSQSATQADLDALGEWFSTFGSEYWNGEYYDADGYRLFPVYSSEGDQFDLIGYKFR